MRKYSTQGATLVEVLLGLAFAAGILFVVVNIVMRVLGSPDTELVAAEWGKIMGMNVLGAQCARIDSDGDGYVSCTLSTKTLEGRVELVAIECAARLSINDGCRMQKPGVVRSAQ